MSIEIRDKDPQQDLPKPKAIIVAGQEVGEVKPTMSLDKLVWHACMQFEVGPFDTYLVQGHGSTPNEAIRNGIVAARRRRDRVLEKLNWLECELGTTDKTNEELASSW